MQDVIGEFEVIQGQLCDYCDAREPSQSHLPEHAVDGTERWWQSPPLSRGLQYNKVNLTISLGQVSGGPPYTLIATVALSLCLYSTVLCCSLNLLNTCGEVPSQKF